MIKASGVRLDEFFEGCKFAQFRLDIPVISPANFAAVCERISELRLPRGSAKVSVHAHTPVFRLGSVRLQAGATSSLAGREYLESLARDTATALNLISLFTETATSLGLTVEVG
jgi:hypothetical protein